MVQPNLPPIDTLVFDVGGVLINEYSATGQDVLERIQIDKDAFHTVWKDIVRRFGSGQMSEQDVWHELANHGAPDVSVDEDVMGRPFKENHVIYRDILQQIKKLGDKGYQIAILSNTIEPHAVVNHDAGVYEPFGDNVFLSHEIGIRKPNINAYQYVIDKLAVRNPETVLYFDDREENLIPAEELGMQTFHVTQPDSLLVRLQQLP